MSITSGTGRSWFFDEKVNGKWESCETVMVNVKWEKRGKVQY